MGFPGSSDSKESACNVGDLASVPGLGRCPGEGEGYPLHYSGLKNFMNIYSPWGCKESDMAECLDSNSAIEHLLVIDMLLLKTIYGQSKYKKQVMKQYVQHEFH